MMIRLLRENELGDIEEIESRATPFPWSRRQFDNSLAAGHWIAVVEEGGELRGFSIFSRVIDEASLLNIVIDPDCQGRGYGRTLLVEGLRAMTEQGGRRCFLEVRQSNRAARSLYESLGFEVVGERKAYYPAEGGREDAVVMCRELPIDVDNS